MSEAPLPKRICVIAKARYERPLSRNQLNLRVHRALNQSLDVDVSYLIVQGDERGVVTEQVDGIVAHFVPRLRSELLNQLWFIFSAVRIGRRLIRKHGVRLVSASEPTAGGVAAFVLRSLTGTPFLLQIQGELFDLPPGTSSSRRILTRSVTTFLSRRADGVRCVSRPLMDAAKRLGVPASRLRLVPSRCDTRQFDPDMRWRDRARIRSELGVGEHKRVVLYVGRLTVQKGVSYLLRATQRVLDENSEVLTIIVGSGSHSQELRSEAQRLGLNDHVLFHEAVPYDEVPGWMAAADVFALPTLTEGMPRVVLEAMSMRLPVVASAVGGVPELVRAGETGLLVPPGDVDALSNAISSVVEESTRSREMGRKARKFVMSHYSFDEGIAAFASLIGGMLDKHSVGSG